MKKSYCFFLIALMLSGYLYSQNIQLTDPFNGGASVNEDTIIFRGTPSDFVIEQDVHVKQISAVSGMNVSVKRYEQTFVLSMENYFCWAVCYPAVDNGDSLLWISPASRNLTQNVADKNFHAYLKPNGEQGNNLYMFVFYDNASPNDSSTVWIEFKVFKPGDLNENGTYDAGEISGDLDFNGAINDEEIAGDTDGSGVIDGSELTGDIDGDGVINNGELLGDKNGDKILQAGETTTSLKNYELNLGYTIFPIPAKNSISISSEVAIGTFKIYDILGSLVHLQNTLETSATIDISNWNKGVYFISKEGGKTQRIVVN